MKAKKDWMFEQEKKQERKAHKSLRDTRKTRKIVWTQLGE